MASNLPTITTKQIGETLDREYPNNSPGPIDYFYLQFRQCFIYKPKQKEARNLLTKELLKNATTCTWKKIHPGRDWPAVFFGKFERSTSEDENERQQEVRLNRNVVRSLKKT